MDSRFKKLYWAGAGAIFLLFLHSSLVVILPKIVSSDSLKSTIKAQAAKHINGDFDFQKA